MPKDDATKFGRALARLNSLALDRPDLCVAAGGNSADAWLDLARATKSL